MGAEQTVVAIRDLARYEGQAVTLAGWLNGSRTGGKVVFLVIRDGTGLCQSVVEPIIGDAFAIASVLGQETSLTVTGVVRRESRAPGGFEIAVTGLRVLQAAVDYPITRKAHGIEFLMAHRHLWFRSQRQTAILRIRHTLAKACRDFFDDNGFTLIDTPILVPGAGEDSQTLFPVDYFGGKSFLSQTGQLYLETACMALGKVYCFGPTFRAEKSKTRRHLTEFWMIEPEVAFADLAAVMDLAENMICFVVARVLERHRDDLALLGRDTEPLAKIVKPFPRITYADAMALLRSDATRLQLDAALIEDRERLKTLVVEMDKLQAERGRVTKGNRMEQLDARIHEVREQIRDLDQDITVRPEHIRLAQSFVWGKDLGGSDETIIARQFERPVFVTHYPREVKAFYMKVDPGDSRLVCNFDLLAPEGYGEIIGGSQREDDLAVLTAGMRIKGLDPDDYRWYLDLRRYGSVPHGGFGLGIERTLAWICGLQHVRETIPFPRLMGRLEM